MNVDWNAPTWKTWTTTFGDGHKLIRFEPCDETYPEVANAIRLHGPIVSTVEGTQPNPMLGGK